MSNDTIDNTDYEEGWGEGYSAGCSKVKKELKAYKKKAVSALAKSLEEFDIEYRGSYYRWSKEEIAEQRKLFRKKS